MSHVIDGAINGDPVTDQWCGFYRAPYFVVSRAIASAMPLEWQERFVQLMVEYDDAIGEHLSPKMPDHSWTYMVKLRGSGGRLERDPLADYRCPPKAVRDMEAALHDHDYDAPAAKAARARRGIA
jgi:hypothetical protein